MNEHDDIRALLPLAASGDLTPAEMRRVQEHVGACAKCRSVSADFETLACGLGALPTPQPSPELVAQVRELAAVRLERKPARTQDAVIVALLVAASWIAAVISWPLVGASAKWALTAWSLPGGDLGSVMAAYSILGFLLAGIAALAVSRHAQAMRRIR